MLLSKREPPSASTACGRAPEVDQPDAAVRQSLTSRQRSLDCLEPEDWQTPVPNHHYSLGQIGGSLSLLLDCRGSLRGTALTSGLIGYLLGGRREVPSPTTVRSWLLRVGLHQLQRPLPKADDWVWIVDHTVQIGELKCMIIVGLRLDTWQRRENRTLAYEDVDLIGLWPVRTSTGEIVNRQLESATRRTGVPRLIVSDDGRDLHKGVALFRQQHTTVDWIYDIKHKTASLLKRELQNDPVWTAFAQRANLAKRHVYLTELAFCNPPQQRGKARYMSADTLVTWGVKMLRWLDDPRPTGRDLDPNRIEEKLGWLRDYHEPLQNWRQALAVIETVETLVRREGYHAGSPMQLRRRLPPVKADSLADRLRAKLLDFVIEQASRAGPRERLPGSSEVLESIIGKYKALQGEYGQFGATSMLLSIGSMIGRITLDGVRTALQTVKAATLATWEDNHLGSTVQSQRKQAFPNSTRGTKTGSRQPAFA